MDFGCTSRAPNAKLRDEQTGTLAVAGTIFQPVARAKSISKQYQKLPSAREAMQMNVLLKAPSPL